MTQTPKRMKLLLRQPPAAAHQTPRQLLIPFQTTALACLHASERDKVIACLANVLLQAAGAEGDQHDRN